MVHRTETQRMDVHGRVREKEVAARKSCCVVSGARSATGSLAPFLKAYTDEKTRATRAHTHVRTLTSATMTTRRRIDTNPSPTHLQGSLPFSWSAVRKPPSRLCAGVGPSSSHSRRAEAGVREGGCFTTVAAFDSAPSFSSHLRAPSWRCSLSRWRATTTASCCERATQSPLGGFSAPFSDYPHPRPRAGASLCPPPTPVSEVARTTLAGGKVLSAPPVT